MNCNIAVMRWTTIPAKNEIVMIPMPKSGKNSILLTPFEFGWGEAARCLEVEDRERNLAKLGPSRYTNAKWIRAAVLLSAGKSQ